MDKALDTTSQQFPWKVLTVLSVYRLVLFFILTIVYLTFFLRDTVFHQSYYVILTVGVIYLAFCIMQFILSLKRTTSFNNLAFSEVFIDILFFGFLITTNLQMLIFYGVLMNIVIAAGSIIVAGRTSLLFASWAAICVLAIQSYFALSTEMTLDTIQNTGFLCITFFVIAIIAYSLSRRAKVSEQIAAKRGEDIAALEKINDKIVKNMSQGVLVIDEQDRIVSSNAAAWYLLGTAKREGKPVLSEVSHSLMSSLQSWRDGASVDAAQKYLADVGLSPDFTSLTDSKGARKATIIIMEDAAELSKQAQQIKLASLGRLTASIAHEIRNPLSSISHAAQLLSEELISDDGHRYAEIIKNNSNRVNDIIESILQLSRRKESTPKKIQLMDWLEQFKVNLESLYDKPIEINIYTEIQDPIVMFDSNQLRQVLENICDNGIIYSEKAIGKSTMDFVIGYQLNSDKVLLDVRDAGEGISDEKIEYIFEPFFTSKKGGTGLGLYIARELCQANGARINYLKSPETGSCFRILFR